MSSRPKANISKKTPAPLLEQAALAMVKDLVEQGRAKEVFREFRAHPAGKAVLKEEFPGPVETFYLFLKGPDSVHDDTEGLILASKAPWLKTLLEEHKAQNKDKLVRGSLGGFKLCWDEKSEAVEWASERIHLLSKEDIEEVVGKGLGVTVDFRHNPDDEENDEDEEEDEDAEYDHSEWCGNNVEEIEEALDTKLGELFTYDTEFVSPATIKEWEKLNRGHKVLGSFFIETTNWS